MSNTMKGAFASHALIVHNLGLWPLPCGGDDGKKPLPSGYNHCEFPYSETTIHGFAKQWPDANLGVLTGKSGMVVVDVDSPDLALLQEMMERFGETPLITRTGSGNYHLWYKACGDEKARDLRSKEGIPVEIKAERTLVIVPPSVNFKTHGPYLFESGGWDDLARLPFFDGQSLRSAQSKSFSSKGKLNSEGWRNSALFHFLLQQVPYCDSIDDLQDIADTYNQNNHVAPETQSKVDSTVRKAWQYQVEGRNFAVTPSWMIPFDLIDVLAPHKKCGDAIFLYIKLQQSHGVSTEPFCLATANMAEGDSLPGWTERRYRGAKDALLKMKLIELIRKGRRKKDGKMEPHLYGLLPMSNLTRVS